MGLSIYHQHSLSFIHHSRSYQSWSLLVKKNIMMKDLSSSCKTYCLRQHCQTIWIITSLLMSASLNMTDIRKATVRVSVTPKVNKPNWAFTINGYVTVILYQFLSLVVKYIIFAASVPSLMQPLVHLPCEKVYYIRSFEQKHLHIFSNRNAKSSLFWKIVAGRVGGMVLEKSRPLFPAWYQFWKFLKKICKVQPIEYTLFWNFKIL